MEHTSVGRETLAIFRRVQPDFPKTRVAVQAYLRSSIEDLHAFGDRPPRIRLVKGAFDRPSTPPSATRPT